ncbi:hypothetical protein LCGC14_2026590 [marine sediment metagenome]|uniref:Uncharacterized protein n=1 Tax=marine sediment metagenome TaxID=412755 RepID=A0A0F9EVW4_9ZZZZ
MGYERDVDLRVQNFETEQFQPAKATNKGEIFTADWYVANLLKGNVFSVNVGTVTGPVTAAGTVATTTPDLHLQIPTNTKIFPVSLAVNIDLAIDDTNLEIVAAISNGRDSSPTGGTSQTILNRNNRNGNGSNCIAQSDVTGITSMVTDRDYLEFFRVNGTFGATPVAAQSEEGQPMSYTWRATEDGPLVATGPSELALMIGKSTFAYFATLTWVELAA